MASNRIKGLTIEIGGDTTKLSDSLKGVDKSLRDTQSQLRDVNKLLKLDPKNTDLLKQKQELLSKQVEDTKKRLDELKKAQETMDQNGVDKNSDQYKALQREIIETKQNLDKAKDAAKDFGSVLGQQLQEAGKSVKETGDKIKGFGDSMTKNVTAPIVGVGAAAMAGWAQIDEGLDIVTKKTGATGDAMTEFEGIVKNIGKTIPTSFAAAGEAVGEVNTRFGVTGQELEDLSTLFIKFADINDTDVTSSVDSVQKVLAAYNLEAKDTGNVLDILTKVSQNTGISIGTLESGLLNNSAAFQEMGLSVEQAADFMGQVEMSGADVNSVMSGLSKALKNSAKDGKDMGTALSELQESIKNGTDATDGLTAAYELFGKSGDKIYGAIQNGSLDFQNLGQSALDAGGTVEGTFDGLQDPVDKFQVVMNQLSELGYEIANALMPTIQTAIETIIPVIQSITDSWNSLSEGQQGFIIKAALVVAAVGPILSAIGSVISIVGGCISAVGSLSGVLGGLSMTVVGPVAAAIAAAIAVGVLLWKNWDTVKQKAQELWEKISDTFAKIKETIGEKIEGAKEKVRSAIEAIKGFFNFKFEWPKLKMPHFTFSGTMNPLKWATEGVPKIGVEWYRKAMNDAFLLDGATIFGASNGRLLGGGEAGKEVILGLDKLKEYAGSTVVNVDMTVNAAPGQSAEEIAREVSDRIQREVLRKRAVWS